MVLVRHPARESLGHRDAADYSCRTSGTRCRSRQRCTSRRQLAGQAKLDSVSISAVPGQSRVFTCTSTKSDADTPIKSHAPSEPAALVQQYPAASSKRRLRCSFRLPLRFAPIMASIPAADGQLYAAVTAAHRPRPRADTDRHRRAGHGVREVIVRSGRVINDIAATATRAPFQSLQRPE